MTAESKSTDKLEIICSTIERKILADDTLKNKVTKIKIDWKDVPTGDMGENLMACPTLEVELKQ